MPVTGSARQEGVRLQRDELQRWEFGSAELDWASARELGRGNFGVVWDISCSAMRVAAKRMDVGVGRQREEVERLLRREFRALNSVVHSNVVRTLGVVVDDPSYVCLLVELANGGSLRVLLDATPERVVEHPATQLSLATDMAHGMAHLHGLQPPILHHDLKSDNVLLHILSDTGGGGMVAKIGDFGLATGIGDTTLGGSTRAAAAGSVAYKAPEQFNGEFTRASDVYAFAIVCWELLAAVRPWSGQFEAAVMGAVVMRQERPAIPPAPPPASPSRTLPSVDVHALLSGIITRSWQQEARNRPSFDQVARQLDVASAQAPQPLERSGSFRPLEQPDVFISFRFGEAHTEAIALKSALEQLGFRVFLSNVVPGDDLQHVISQALAVSKLTIILATKTYGQRTNGLFDTSSEMNYVIGQAKPYYLIRMIPSNEAWAEPHVTMAFPSSIMYKLWMPGDPMPWDLLHELSALLMPASAAAGAAPSPA